MLMKRRGVHAGLVVKVSLFSNVNRRPFKFQYFVFLHIKNVFR